MADVEVKNKDNKKVDSISLSDDVFGLPVKASLMHESVVNYLANQRQGTHATKTRGMVRGGGAKPFKQKGTGRARQGSSRSPLMKGGATLFGPQPRDYSYRLNRKQKRSALKNALSAKVTDQQVLVIDSLSFDEPKTKNVTSLLDTFGISGKSVLIVTREKDQNVYLSSRNIPHVDVQPASDINVYSLMAHEYLLVTKDALLQIQEAMQ